MESELKVLVVDDKMENRYLLESMLGASGYETVTVSNGIEALKILRTQKIDAIISDLLMPKMDGFQLIRECKKDPQLKDIPFIIYTATYTDTKDIDFGMSLGAARYIIKPAEADALLLELNDAIARSLREELGQTMQFGGQNGLVEREYSRRLVSKLDKKVRELEKSEELFRKIFENSPLGMAIVAPDYRFLSVNPAFVVMTGYPEGELLQMSFMDITHPDCLNADLEQVQKLRNGEIPVFRAEKRYVRKDKSVLWGLLMVTAIRDSEGSLRSFAAQVEDITLRKRAEEELRESEARYRLLADASPEMVYMVDTEGCVRYVNKEAARQFRASPSDLVGKPLSDLFPPEMAERHMEAIRKVATTRQTIIGELVEDFPEGRVCIEARLTPVIDDQDRVVGVLGLSNDITQRKQVEEQRERLIHDLADKNAELDRFTYTVSHDLKSPLMAIRAFIALLEDDMKSGNAEQVSRDIVRIRDASEKLEVLINSLLTLSRSGRSVATPQPVAFLAISREAAGLLEPAFKERNIRLIIPESLPVVSGDRQRLLQVMTNLLDNAVKFMGDQPEPVIEIGIRDSAVSPVLFVRDNGIGIRREDLPRVFELYERLHPGIPGTGVGLATVKRIIEAHGGEVWAESEGVGKGTTFFFTLPVPETEGS